MNLAQLQRQMAADIMRPLGRGDRNAPGIAAPYITRNDRLTSRHRLEIYRHSYWYRLLDSLYEDFPGLRAVLGKRAFLRLITAYLVDCPSRCFTMRDLGSRLESWLKKTPSYAGDQLALALDMIRLEWAHIEAWDARSEATLNAADLANIKSSVLSLQPYLRLIELQYPMDELRLRVNTATEGAHIRRPSWRKPASRFLAVHRLNYSVYYKTLSRAEFQILKCIQQGRTIDESVSRAIADISTDSEKIADEVAQWFRTWAIAGWFTKPSAGRSTD